MEDQQKFNTLRELCPKSSDKEIREALKLHDDDENGAAVFLLAKSTAGVDGDEQANTDNGHGAKRQQRVARGSRAGHALEVCTCG
jgi:hypothetical protein